MRRIFLVEDDKDVIEVTKTTLEMEGFSVSVERDGMLAARKIIDSNPDLLLLDINLPRYSGLEICKEIRRHQKLNRLPIIMVTARQEVGDRVLGLEVGADDYLTKPFDPRELVARVRALLRRLDSAEGRLARVQVGDLSIDPASYTVTRRGQLVGMSTLEFRLLYFLATHPGRVFSRDELLDKVWGRDRFVTPRSVDFYVAALRKKIEDDPSEPCYIKTQRGAGYLFHSS